ncbi:MAG TPA: RpiB/LacA/LacB family sugar-phosphate isomerase [Candidatus Limnocylindrales bacterium]|nr:RpiB/LacA/LacB family sugar-phosphate isomerase [Candidatus Limnocylindrales bacterium]
MAERRLPDEIVIRQLVERALEVVEAGAAPAQAELMGAAGPTGAPDPKTVAIGADHGGYGLKAVLIKHLRDKGFAVTDCGTNGPDAVDYPDFAHVVARLVSTGACATGIAIDGAGIGSAMTANKVPGVRAANAHDTSMARNAREHNYANVLTLGARMIGEGMALEITDTFLATAWGAERHGRRVAKITQIEQQYRNPAGEEPKR